MSLDRLLNGVKVLATVCNQWGDTGKGKFAYLFSEWADVNARGGGGHQAGHTIVRRGIEKVYHLIPVGIEQDSLGKVAILGEGMVILPDALVAELDDLDTEGLSYNHLMVSEDAHVITSYHIAQDRTRNQSMKSGGIGSTGRGIGPCYGDKINRRGIRMRDLLDKDVLVKKIKEVVRYYPEQNIDVDQLVGELVRHRDRIRPLLRNTTNEMHRFMREGKRISIEGAHGLLLSIEHGTYPYVTSSDCSANGTASGVGLLAKSIDLILGIVKFPYNTRVGGGPHPTEFGGTRSEEYCASEDPRYDKAKELELYGIPHSTKGGKVSYNWKDQKILDLINSEDFFLQGVGIRLAGNEYGATTGRPRRTGWTDAIAGKYAVGINGPRFILTKADVLAGAREFKINYSYSDDGVVSQEFDRDAGFLRRIKPCFRTYEGYGDIQDVRKYGKLPESLRKAIEEFEEFTGGRVDIISVGADTDQTIIKEV